MARVGDLELDQDLAQQQREWKAERFAWIIWILLLLATLAGLLGPGPFSNATAGNVGDSLWVEYDRFIRHRAPTELVVHLQPEMVHEGIVALSLDQSFLDQVEIERIEPEPNQEQAAGERTHYVFEVAESEQPLVVTFHLEPGDSGPLSTTVAVPGNAEVGVSQYVFP